MKTNLIEHMKMDKLEEKLKKKYYRNGSRIYSRKKKKRPVRLSAIDNAKSSNS
jgi:hypothetical protein